ncbi:MAG: polysaccharide biosynthesis C-terminal domain-containing protein [Opitutaceae bacterium]
MQATAPAPTLERQGTHALLTSALSVVLGLLLSVVIARTLGPEGKGVLDVASASAALFALFFGGSLNVGLTHLVARHGGSPPNLARQLAFWGIGAALVSLGCLALQPDLTIRLGLLPPNDIRFWLSFVAATVGCGVWSAGLRGILIGAHASITVNRIELAVKTVLLAIYLTLAAGGFHRPQAFAIAGVVCAAGLTVASTLAPRGPEVLVPGWWPALLAASLPMHGNNLLQFVNQRADVFFIQASHGSGEVGRYALAVSLAQIVLLIASALAQPLLPRVSAARSPAEAADATAGICRQFIALGVMITGALLLGGTWLVPHVFGRDFSGSIPSLVVLLPGIIAYGVHHILIAYFAGIDRSRVNVAISTAALVVTVAGNVWLTRRYGALGAALTSTCAYTLGAVLSVTVFVRRTGISPRDLLCPTAADWRDALLRGTRFRL